MKKNYLLILFLLLLTGKSFSQSNNFTGEIIASPYARLLSGWALCDGSILQINDYPDLYSVIGNIYGGDGITTFALPDLRGRVPVGQGQGVGLTNKTLGQQYGQETVTLTSSNLPAHNHQITIKVNNTEGKTNVPAASSSISASGFKSGKASITNTNYTIAAFETITNTELVKIGNTGQQAPASVSIIKPSLVLNYIICLSGNYPVQ